ncbi:MAG: 5-oxoprolinase subunit PxpB [Gammaproteobacteria bacterium]|nr:5-oxoprolinase subunit PxpB [Gammaproteobacteria bacterium]
MLYEHPAYRIMGDRALLVELGDGISPLVNKKVRELFLCLKNNRVEGVVETMPGYRSLLIVYDPLKITLSALKERLNKLHTTIDRSEIPKPRTLEIPVVYGGECGPDLNWVAEYHKLSPEEVVRFHTGTTYQVYMIGFTPGFAYMGQLPEAIATPRRETPRTAVPRGSVGIAQSQTGVYPVESPGGWQIIGRTPLRLFDPEKWPPTPLEMGDLVKFLSIKEEEMARWEV